MDANGGWQWPESLSTSRKRSNEPNEEATPVKEEYASAFTSSWKRSDTPHQESNTREEEKEDNTTTSSPREQPQQNRRKERHWKPRTCRICLDTVLPTFTVPSENLPGIFQSKPSVVYESEDSGRLIRPCKCKGTAQFVHESCLQAWRHSDPGYARRNYFECPTCGYKYQLQRLGWGRMISSAVTQIALTLVIFILVIFTMGFIADPVIDFALDPYGSIMPWFSSYRRPIQFDILDEGDGWLGHFAKGFASLGLLSFLKVIFTSPVQFFFRSSGVGSRAGTNGRDRLSNTTWLLIIIGVSAFIYTIWKAVRAWSRRALEKAGERVMDVKVDDEFEDDED